MKFNVETSTLDLQDDSVSNLFNQFFGMKSIVGKK